MAALPRAGAARWQDGANLLKNLATQRPRWIPSSSSQAITSEVKLLDNFLSTPFQKLKVPLASGAGVNTTVVCVGSGSVQRWRAHRHNTGRMDQQDMSQHNVESQETSTSATARDRDSNKVPVVLCHGYMSGLGMFFRNLDGLASRFGTVITKDWLGMGLSDRPKFLPKVNMCTEPTDTHIDEAETFYTTSLENWREEMGLESMHLMGHSLGGYLVTAYAHRYPHRVRSLTLISPVGIPEAPTDAFAFDDLPLAPRMMTKAWNANITPPRLLRGLGPYGPQLAQRMISRRFSGSLPAAEAQLVADYLYHVSVGKGSGEYVLKPLLQIVMGKTRSGVFARRSISPYLNSFARENKVPVTVMYGDNDWMYHDNIHSFLDDSITLAMIPRAGHHLYLENNEEFQRVLQRHIPV